ncbi:hypothetical protein HD554DRAFT_2070693 [Boletus coccyginus]|nr:hypothetical protein HD554DRAFT_2070693 [Boletus coccyginus]
MLTLMSPCSSIMIVAFAEVLLIRCVTIVRQLLPPFQGIQLVQFPVCLDISCSIVSALLTRVIQSSFTSQIINEYI